MVIEKFKALTRVVADRDIVKGEWVFIPLQLDGGIEGIAKRDAKKGETVVVECELSRIANEH